MSTFSDILNADLSNVFFNETEFSKSATYIALSRHGAQEDSITISLVPQSEKMPVLGGGGYKDSAVFLFADTGFTQDPKTNDKISWGGDTWRVETLDAYDEGVYTVTCRKEERGKY